VGLALAWAVGMGLSIRAVARTLHSHERNSLARDSSQESLGERQRRIEKKLRPWFRFGTPVVAGLAAWIFYGPVEAMIALSVPAVTLAVAERMRQD
jgi:hypothetical protein